MRSTHACLAVLFLFALGQAAAQGEQSGTIVLGSANAKATTEATSRLTTVVPRTPTCSEAENRLQIRVQGILEGAADKSVELDVVIVPGPSVQVDDQVSNLHFGFHGTLRAVAPGSDTTWRMTPTAVDVFFPKTYYRDGRLSLMIPTRFEAPNGEAANAILGVVLSRQADEFSVVAARFAFGDALARRLEPKGASWERLFLPTASAVSGSESLAPSRSGSPAEVLSCCIGEYHCDCVARCQGSADCPWTDCKTCMPDECFNCRDLFGCGNCVLSGQSPVQG